MSQESNTILDIKQKTVTIGDYFTFKNALYLNNVAMYQNDIDKIIIYKEPLKNVKR